MNLHWPKSRHTPVPVLAKPLVSFEQAKNEFDAQRLDAEKFRTWIATQLCPLCGTAKMELVAYEKGRDGWEAAITCNSCFVKGVFNSDGFRIVRPANIEIKQR